MELPSASDQERLEFVPQPADSKEDGAEVDKKTTNSSGPIEPHDILDDVSQERECQVTNDHSAMQCDEVTEHCDQASDSQQSQSCAVAASVDDDPQSTESGHVGKSPRLHEACTSEAVLESSSISREHLSDCDMREESGHDAAGSLDADGDINMIDEEVALKNGIANEEPREGDRTNEKCCSTSSDRVWQGGSDGHSACPLETSTPKHKDSAISATNSECSRNPELLAALLTPEPTLAKSDSLKTVVNAMVEVGMRMPLSEPNGLPDGPSKTAAHDGEMTHLGTVGFTCTSAKQTSSTVTSEKQELTCKTCAANSSDTILTSTSDSCTNSCQSGTDGASKLADHQCTDDDMVRHSTSPVVSMESIKPTDDLAGIGRLTGAPCMSSASSETAVISVTSVSTICTTVIRKTDKSSPVVIWKAESDVSMVSPKDNFKISPDVVPSAVVNKDKYHNTNSKNDLVPQTEMPEVRAMVNNDSVASVAAMDDDSVMENVETCLDGPQGKSSGESVTVNPIVITPADATPDVSAGVAVSGGAEEPPSSSPPAMSLPQIAQVFGGMTGMRLQQLHEQGSISTVATKNGDDVNNSHSLLKSMLNKQSSVELNHCLGNTKEVNDSNHVQGNVSYTLGESGNELLPSDVFIKDEKIDPGYPDAAGVKSQAGQNQVVKKVVCKKAKQQSGTDHGRITRSGFGSKKQVQGVYSMAPTHSSLPQQAGMNSILQKQVQSTPTLLLSKGMIPNAGGVLGKVVKGGNIQVAVPIIMSKAGGQIIGQPPVLFTLAPLPKSAVADLNSLTATTASSSVSSSSVPKTTNCTRFKGSSSRTSLLSKSGVPFKPDATSKGTVASKAGPTSRAVPTSKAISTSKAAAASRTMGLSKTAGTSKGAGTSRTALETNCSTDYGKYLKYIAKVKNEVKGLKNTDAKYVCPMPPASLFLLHKMNRMFVCRGCDSTFHKQSSLSEHQLRRTLSLRYSCQDNCHVLFYNVCQLILHTKTHPPTTSNWQKNIEIGGLPENLLEKMEGMHEKYIDFKTAIYAAANMEQKLKGNNDGEDEKSDLEQTSKDGSPEGEDVNQIQTKIHQRSDTGQKSQTSPTKLGIAEEQRVNTYMDDNPVICTECGTMFEKRLDLAMHMLNSGSSESMYLCKTCPVILRSKCAHSAHSRIHKNSVPYVCPECGQVIHGSHNVFWKHLHVKCMHHIRQVLLVCLFCRKEFRDQKRLIRHTTNQHSTKFHKCQLCPMAFKFQSSVTEHAKSIHEGKVLQKVIYKCPFCVAVYKDDTYVNHLEQHLASSPLTVIYKCNACSKSFRKRSLCINHMTQVHKFYFNRSEMCHICGMDFKLPSSLLHHQLSAHPNIKDLDDALTRCLKHSRIISSDESASLASPARAASVDEEDVTGDKQPSDRPLTVLDIKEEPTDDSGGQRTGQFSCDRCQVTLDNAQSYQRHMAKHQFIEKKRLLAWTDDRKLKFPAEPSENLVLKVKIPKLSVRDAKSNSGQVTQTKAFTKQVPGAPDPEPLYDCSECNRAFYLEESLARHLKKEHNQERQFPCHLCGNTYRDQETLKSHLKKLHEGWSRDKPYMCWICQEKDIRKNFPKRMLLIRHISKEHRIARNLIDYSKIPDPNKDSTKTYASPVQMSPSSVDDERKTPSEQSTEMDVPPVKRLKLAGESSFSCVKCSFTTEDRAIFVSHIKKHQPSKLSDAKICLECGLSFTVTQSLKRHLLVVHQVRNFDKYMEESGVDLVSQPEEEEVTMPKKTANPQPDKISKPRGFMDSKQYKYKRAQKEAENDELECKVCYKLFTDELELRAHMRTHGMAYIKSSRRLDDA